MHSNQVLERSHNSPHWKRLLVGRDLTKNQFFWILGEGKKPFWMDRWLGLNTIQELCNVEVDEDRQCSELWTEGSWDVHKLMDINIPQDVREKILDIPILQDKDKICWTLSKDGCFSTKCAWNHIREKHDRNNMFKPLSCGYLRTNVRIFGLRLLKNWIPTDTRIQTKGIQLASACQCFKYQETAQHLFCGMSRKSKGVEAFWEIIFPKQLS